MVKYFKIILLLSFITTFSQNKKIDSLKFVLDTHIQRDSIRVDILNKIASKVYQNNNDKAIELIAEAIAISDSLKYNYGKAESLYTLGKIHTAQYKLDQAKKEIEQAIELFKTKNNKLGVAKSLNHIGVIYFYRNENENALEYFYKALDKNKDVKSNVIKAISYNNLGIIFNNQGKQKEALKYYNKTINIYKELKELKRLSVVLNNIGIIYIKNKEYNKALEVYRECLDINKKFKNKYLTAHVYNNLGDLYKRKGNHNRALFYFLEALQINRKIKNYAGICESEKSIAQVLIKKGKLERAIKHLKNGRAIANKHSMLRSKMEISELFSNLFYKKKDYKKSLFYYKEFKKNYDSVFSAESHNKFSNLETKYKFKEKELLAKEKEIKLKEQIEKTNKKLEKTRRQVTYTGITLIVLLVAFIFIIYHLRIKRLSSEYQKISLEQKLLRSQMKPHFIFNSLSVLQGIVLHKEYQKAQMYISKFSRLLRKILESSREETVNLETELSIINNYIFLRNMNSDQLNYDYHISVGKNINPKNTFIPPMIVQPIVENAFEHGFVDPNKTYDLSIDFKLKNENLTCTIIDNGIGLQNKMNSNSSEKKSISSTIILERLHLFSVKYKKEYSLKIIDRKKFGKQGTKVVLLLPYKIIEND